MKRIGTLITAPIRISDDVLPLPVAYSTEINGGVHYGETIAERDSLPVYYRSWGMLFYIKTGVESDHYYLKFGKVDASIANNQNWERLSLGTPGPVGTSNVVIDKVVVAQSPSFAHYVLKGRLLSKILIKSLSNTSIEIGTTGTADSFLAAQDILAAKHLVISVDVWAQGVSEEIIITGLPLNSLVYFLSTIIEP